MKKLPPMPPMPRLPPLPPPLPRKRGPPPWDWEKNNNQKTLSFQFQSRTLTGTGYTLNDRATVFKLELDCNSRDCLVEPNLVLPTNLILKKRKKGWDEEFEREKVMYKRLLTLQGEHIPIYYGEACCEDGVPALLISDIGGFELWRPEAAFVEKEKFEKMLLDLYSAIGQFGVFHGDNKLDNYHLVGDKIMAVDIEAVEEIDAPMDVLLDIVYGGAIERLWRMYKGHEGVLIMDGHLKEPEAPCSSQPK